MCGWTVDVWRGAGAGFRMLGVGGALVFGVGLEYFFAGAREKPLVAVTRKADRVNLPERPGARDAAYHQGTVWAWLIGPFIDAWLKVYPEDRSGAHEFLRGFIPQMNEHGIGTISEVFDAEQPWTPHGCIAQAWSVAEVLRCWIKTAP